MSLSIMKLRSLWGMHTSLLASSETYHNLKRGFVNSCSLNILESNRNVLMASQCLRVPFRSFYKHQVEVDKRIQWKRPVRVQSVLPQKSGDLSGRPVVDLNEPPPLFKECAEFQTANEHVKRILSLKFQPTSVVKEVRMNAMMDKVRRHKYDFRSVEVKIAKYTAVIRNLQVHYANYPQDSWHKADLKEIIDLRKKRLKLLRTLDYKRFEWLLEKLDLLYKPPPTSHERVERKKSMRWLAEEYAEKVKEKKLEEYRKVLDSQKREFLQNKLSAMKTIVEEENSVGTEPSFTAEELEQAEQALRARIEEEERTSPIVTEIKEVY